MVKVAIFGGGVAGLSAAHELVERGFQVALYEQAAAWGGKARSYGVPGSGTGGRKDLPAEHGFRLFPGFYKHLPDTMKRIPFGANPNGVFDNLVTAPRAEIARSDRPPVVLQAAFPTSLDDWATALHALFAGADLGLPPAEVRTFVGKLLVILTSCQERRLAQYERWPWWKFIEAEGKSAAYQQLLGTGLTRKLVAMQARQASTRTVGTIGIQLLLDVLTPGQTSDRVLNGPTSEVWLDPWVRYLEGRGVALWANARLAQLELADGRIRAATIERAGQAERVEADYYVCAVPVEVMCRLLTPELKAAAPSLAQLDQLHSEWMSGLQFYLRRDVPVLRGHVLYADSAWSLTSISPHQFWPAVRLEEYGDGNIGGILSVDVADWESPGDQVVRKPASACSAAEIRAEVWAQIQAHLDEGGQQQLEAADLVGWSLDASVQFPSSLPAGDRNQMPLLVNTAGSWQYRPEADLSNGVYREIENLFVAGDYVRTHTDLATMEGANEAARRAVNGILRAAGSGAMVCGVWPLVEPAVLAPLRAYDYARFKLGYPHSFPQPPALPPSLRQLATKITEFSPPPLMPGGLRPNQYRFREEWTVPATPEQVWSILAEPAAYSSWWRQYPQVRRLNALDGAGAVTELHIQFLSELPYRLRFTLELMRSEPPHLVEWRARGDLNGRISFALQEEGAGTRVTYASDLTTGKLLLNVVSPATRPFFLRNHAVLMRHAEEDLRAELARRAAQNGKMPMDGGRFVLVQPGEGRSLRTPTGTLVTIKAISEDTRGAYTLLELKDAPQGGRSLHSFDRVDGGCYILEGTYQFQLGSRRYMAPVGSFIYLPRGVPRSWTNTGATAGTMLMIVSPAGIEEAVEQLAHLPAGQTNISARMALGQKYGLEIAPPGAMPGWGGHSAPEEDVRVRSAFVAAGSGAAFQALGIRVTVKAAGEETSGAYALLESSDPPQAGPPLHVHTREDEGFYILAGEYQFHVGDRFVTATPGCFVLAPRCVPHEYRSTGTRTGRYLLIASPSGFEKFVAAVGEPAGPVPMAPSPPSASNFARIEAIARRFGIEFLATPQQSGPLYESGVTR